jgi:hypothetical protein
MQNDRVSDVSPPDADELLEQPAAIASNAQPTKHPILDRMPASFIVRSIVRAVGLRSP